MLKRSPLVTRLSSFLALMAVFNRLTPETIVVLALNIFGFMSYTALLRKLNLFR